MIYKDYNNSVHMITQDSGEVLVDGTLLQYTLKGSVDDALFLRLKHIGEDALEAHIVDRVLFDICDVEQFSRTARIALFEFLKKQPSIKIGIVGGNRFVRTVISFVVSSVDFSNVRLMNDKKETLQWLGS